MRTTLKTFSLIVAMLAGAAPALAQLPTGTVLGTVRDSANAIVPGRDADRHQHGDGADAHRDLGQ